MQQEFAPGEWYDLAYVVVMRRRPERDGAAGEGPFAEGLSQGVRFPVEAVQEASRRGFAEVTAGDVLAEMTGCSPKDPHHHLTGGRFPRQRLLEDAVCAVAAQLLARECTKGRDGETALGEGKER